MRYLSLFSGMEAAHIAWHPLGWTCAAVAEVDPAACALLRHRLPSVPNLGDVTSITDGDIARLGRIDVVIGGSPCQDLSVAGKRAGLAGARSSLFHEQLRIFHAARTLCGARWLIWENVPGAFSSNKGRDFAVVVGAMAGCELDVPRDGWGNEGLAVGDNGLVEWAVLDSQWFGVAQRRRRVFAVLDTGDWSGRPPVLLEPESLRGDFAPRRKAGESVAGTLSARTSGGGGLGTDFEVSGGLIPQYVMAHGQGGAEIVAGERSPTLTCNHEAPILVQEVAHTIRADGFDASEDGTGRGTPLVPCYAIQAGAHPPAIAFDFRQDCISSLSVSGPLGASLPQAQAVALQRQDMQVRRLTPIECERLQGAPDNWTLVPNAKGKPMADGPRYKMLGNSFTATVIRWIGWRIQVAHGYSEQQLQEAA